MTTNAHLFLDAEDDDDDDEAAAAAAAEVVSWCESAILLRFGEKLLSTAEFSDAVEASTTDEERLIVLGENKEIIKDDKVCWTSVS